MKRLAGITALVAVSAFGQSVETATFNTVLSPANEVPPININAQGFAVITAHVVRDGQGRITSGSVDFDVTFQFPDAVTITGLHIHNGPAGVNAGVVIDTRITGMNPVAGQTRGNIRRQAQVRSDNAAGLAALEGMFTNPGGYYVNLHTTDNPGGVIRGQLRREQLLVLIGEMTTAKEVPVVTDVQASGTGAVHAYVTRDGSGAIVFGRVTFDVNYRVAEKTTFTGLHIHRGGATDAGPVTINSGLSGTNTVETPDSNTGNIRLTATVDTANAAGLQTLEGLFTNPDGYYINLHSTVKPGGVIRSQLRHGGRVEIPVTLSAANEVPPIAGLDATAPAKFTLWVLRNPDGSVPAAVAAFDVNHRFPAAAEFTGLHIHNGAATVNGGVTIDSGLSGANSISTTDGFGNIYSLVLVSTEAGLATVNSLLANPDRHYMNLHTRVNPSGAVRSQLGSASSALPAVAAIISAASATSVTNLAPGALISIYGINLARVAADVTGFGGASLPASLNGVSVSIGGRPAPLLLVSPGQINAQVPADLAPGATTVTVTTAAGTSATFNATVAAAAPSIFFDGTGGIIVKNSDFSLIRPDNPARAGDILVIYATGLGRTTPAIGTGALAGGPPFGATAPATVTIGGREAEVIYSLASPGFVGLYQVAVRVPPGLSAGNQAVVLRIGGVGSNSVNLAVQ